LAGKLKTGRLATKWVMVMLPTKDYSAKINFFADKSTSIQK